MPYKDKAYSNYGGRGIKCLFESSDCFVNYVIKELKIDPRNQHLSYMFKKIDF